MEKVLDKDVNDEPIYDKINTRGQDVSFEINEKFFEVNKAEFDNQNNMKYIQILTRHGYSFVYPDQTEQIKIEACMLKSPEPVVDKCGIIKKMLKDMVFYDCWQHRLDDDSLCKKAGWPNIEKSTQ